MRLLIVSFFAVYSFGVFAVELADEGGTEAGAIDQIKCEGQCVNSNFNQSKARLSRAEVIDLAQRLFDRGETPKLLEDTKAIKDRQNR